VPHDPFVKRASFIGQFDSAARAMHQSGTETSLELSDRLTDAGLCHAQPFGGSAETACIGNGRKNDQATDQSTVNFIHS
jgi:hypothetical protein